MSQKKTMQECYEAAGCKFPFTVLHGQLSMYTVTGLSARGWEVSIPVNTYWALGGTCDNRVWELVPTPPQVAISGLAGWLPADYATPTTPAPKSCSCDFVLLLQTGCTCGSVERYKGGLCG